MNGYSTLHPHILIYVGRWTDTGQHKSIFAPIIRGQQERNRCVEVTHTTVHKRSCMSKNEKISDEPIRKDLTYQFLWLIA